ncbi:MAG: adenylate/guanylate cyclase domain-containing protein [Gammaproteobacteria bacterium]|nr:adenylate/guanylate cyclase domain-containing protein [Gammaproteobacteria bacterium]
MSRAQALLGYLLILALGALIMASPLPQRASNALDDILFTATRAVHGDGRPMRQPDVVVIGIDEATVAALAEPLALWHRHLGKLIDAVRRAGARALVMDVVLPDRSFDAILPGQDQLLLRALLEARDELPLVIAQTVDRSGLQRAIFAPIVAIAGEDSFGLALLEPDADSVIRTAGSHIGGAHGAFTTMTGRLARILDEDAPMGHIDFSLGPKLSYLSMRTVLEAVDSTDEPGLSEMLEDRVVYLGSVLPFEDRHHSPVPLAAWAPTDRLVPGVLLHAQIGRSLLNGGLIRPAPDWLAWSLALLASLAWWLAAYAWRGLLVGVALLACLTLLAGLSLLEGLHPPAGGVLLIATLAFAARAGLQSGSALLERRRLRQSFAPYVSPAVLQAILSGRIDARTRGERRRVCVLFSDIRSFTTRSESQPPEAIVDLLNRYFEAMTACVHANGGTVDKFIGDGLMAFFGAPADSSNASLDAFRAAECMIQKLQALNRALQSDGIEPVAIGIGLHSGDAVVGHVGSSERHEYTVIGDTVNTAARLEGLTKDLGYTILCSQSVADDLCGITHLTPLGAQAVKGRAPVTVHAAYPVA